ncbi:MAG: SRPBCC family protein [Cyanobacteriota bacterium]|nr:SRPBCC family protein [Cyanobacteriota bacterium]
MSRLSRQVVPTDTYLASLSTSDWATLASRQVLLKGGRGQYGVMVATPVDQTTAWQVLTDYGNFHRFLPTVAESRVVGVEGDRTIVEQLDRRRILLSTVESRIRTENLELNQQQISFQLLEGNLEYMYGHWRLDLTPPQYSPLLLVSQQVQAEAERDLGPFKGMFYRLFETSLVETMQAVRAEMERRRQAPPGPG